MEYQIKKIVEWIQRVVNSSGSEGIVMGLSGGVDSCVTAMLCSEAVGNDFAVMIMPCSENRTDDEKYADIFLKRHKGIDIMDFLFDLNPAYKVISSSISGSFGEDLTDITLGNIKSRLRMVYLYAMANHLNYLVAGTSNKTELELGFLTKHGDGGVDFEPIGDFYKTEIWEMAKILGVPQEIIDREPTAGLWEGQTDEKDIGMSYKEIDKIFKRRDKNLHKTSSILTYRR